MKPVPESIEKLVRAEREKEYFIITFHEAR